MLFLCVYLKKEGFLGAWRPFISETEAVGPRDWEILFMGLGRRLRTEHGRRLACGDCVLPRGTPRSISIEDTELL